MAAQKRIKTTYPGVFYIEGTTTTGKLEKVFYIRYRKDGKLVEEKAGRQYRDDMTPARAAGLRARRVEGKQATNNERRAEERKKKWTIEALADEYFLQKTEGKPKRTEQGRFKLYLKKPFGEKTPQEIDQLSVDRVRLVTMKGKAPQTVKHVLALLARIVRFGTDKGLSLGLKFSVKTPRVDNLKTEDLTPEQLQRLFQVLETTKHRTAATMMKLAFFTGMRRGEIFKLQWDHVDFARGFIHIVEPKGGVSQKIPMNASTRALLEGVEGKGEYVFPARNGGPRKDANKAFAEIRKEADLPTTFRSMHGLRHVFATMLASSGAVDMLQLQKLLTHKDQRMTQRYIHFREEALQKAGETADSVLNEALSFHKKMEANNE